LFEAFPRPGELLGRILSLPAGRPLRDRAVNEMAALTVTAHSRLRRYRDVSRVGGHVRLPCFPSGLPVVQRGV
jgi:hypothetical protein